MNVAQFVDHLIEEFQTVIEQQGADTIAAFIAEPVMASGGVIVPPPGYLKRMRAVCAEHDIIFIADEVVTGFGRLGAMFASEDIFGITPDIIIFAKGVTSGYFPLGGMIVSASLMEDLRRSEKPDAEFAHGLTYSSHPIGCAVALKNIELLQGGILENVKTVSAHFQNKLKELESLALVGEVRGMGLMACIECVADKVSANPISLDLDVGYRIDQHCQALGLLLRPIVNMCVLSPPLIITETQIDELAVILHEGISRTMEDLRREGTWNG